jgi:hypothetical protein
MPVVPPTRQMRRTGQSCPPKSTCSPSARKATRMTRLKTGSKAPRTSTAEKLHLGDRARFISRPGLRVCLQIVDFLLAEEAANKTAMEISA